MYVHLKLYAAPCMYEPSLPRKILWSHFVRAVCVTQLYSPFTSRNILKAAAADFFSISQEI